ncbi:MAG: hypothetical protein ACYDC6_03180 [Acidobacteriaceae bacterium]
MTPVRSLFPSMQFKPPGRSTKVAVAASVVMLLVAMMLPVCHLHPLLDKGAPDHCTICVSLHAALPMGVHLPQSVHLLQAGAVFLAAVPMQSSRAACFAATRAPPLPAC